MKEIIIIVLLVIIIALAWAYNQLWQKKEHYRCRVFDLTKGKEGSNLPKAPDMPPPPAPEGLFPTRPLIVDWLCNSSGEYFRREDVVALTQNPNRTMNVVLGNGHTINTGLELDDLKKVLGIHYSCSVNEELEHHRNLFKKED